ncbi:MAG: DNA polymerase III subunit beta [Oscillospiraceae bacterium]|nr:DNA polymerase III subunit beta [Oscillospiraceae bacterium]
MKIKCEKNVLSEAASVVSRAVSSRSPLPALEGILMRTVEGGVELFGYDLDIGISTKIEAQIEAPGEIVMPAKVLLDIVRKLPGEFVSISVGEKCLTEIKSGVSEFTILGMAADEFPDFPSIGEVTDFSIPQNTLKSMIDQTIFAISQSDAKPIHTGSLFEVKDGFISVVSVDGYRLALRKEKVLFEKQIKFVVPGRALNEVSRILTVDSDETVGMEISKKHIIMHIGNFQVFSRLLEGDFLEYRNSIPKSSSIEVRVNTREMIEAVERVSLLISDRIKSPLRVRFVENEIIMNCSTALGKATDTIGAKIEGGQLEMGFNNRYLLDALRAAQCDEVILQLSGALSPMKVVPVGGEEFLFLVLPVRLKSEV